ncbi:hypothetical protein FOZ60_008622 [Perkinsus olseni]|uniref:Uncharacterized protein n=1 Tax=Perkinsus olseni TaxID=32597 RepID=A0A7J6NIY7_PEROL|nr:hypothetical protein FOZ60_008622 [Perkinsus olseni]
MSSKHIITIAGVVTMLFVPIASLAIGAVKPDDDFPPLLNAGNDSCLFFNADFRAGRKALRVSYDATFKPRLNYITCPKTRSRDALQMNFETGDFKEFCLWVVYELKKRYGSYEEICVHFRQLIDTI